MADSSTRRPGKQTADGSAPSIAVLETAPSSLDGGGFDLSAAGADLPVDHLALVLAPQVAAGPLSGLARLVRRSRSTQPAVQTDDPVTRVTALRDQHPDALIVVHRAASTASPSAKDLMGAGAGIVISTGQKQTSVTRTQGRAVIRLASSLPRAAGGDGGAPGETLQWTARLRRSASATDRLTVQLSVRAASAQGSRPLTSAEMAEVYTDAVLRTGLTREFLELVDGWADASAGHLTVDLGGSGEFELPQRPPLNVRAGWVDDPTAFFAVDSGALATPRILRSELERRGFRVDPVTSNFLLATRADAEVGYFFSNSHRAPQTAVRAAADKGVARAILARAGVAVADGRFFAERSAIGEAEELLTALGSVVVKPVDAGHGNGVTVGVRTPEALRIAWDTAFDVSRTGVLVERHVSGVEARFMVVGDTCVSVSCARPPRITGDGRSTIRQLITALNDVRSRNPLLVSRPVLLDEARIDRMRDHGHTPLTVLPSGQDYDVATDTSWYGGTTTEDITDEVHDTYKDMAVRAVRAFPGLAVAGLDIIMEDYTQPASRAPFAVLEVNSQPGLGLPHFPMIGAARNPAGALIDADLAPHRRTDFSAAPADGTTPEPRPAQPHPATAAIGAELERLGFDLDWLADDYLHAHRDGLSTAVWKSYTTLSGKSAASAAQHPTVSHRLLSGAGIAVPRGWKCYTRDANATRFRNGREALAHAATLRSPALQVANRDFVSVDPTDEKAFSAVWHRLCRSGKRGIAVAEAPTGARVRVLVLHGVAAAIRRVSPAQASDTAPVHPDYLEVATRACEAFRGLELAEVVLHLEDPGAPAAADNHTVSAVRTSPDLQKYQAIVEPTGRSIYRELAEGHVTQLVEELGRG